MKNLNVPVPTKICFSQKSLNLSVSLALAMLTMNKARANPLLPLSDGFVSFSIFPPIIFSDLPKNSDLRLYNLTLGAVVQLGED